MTSRRSSKNRRSREWYGVSVDAVRLGIGVSVLSILGLGAFVGYERWNAERTRQRAFELVTEAERLDQQLRARPEHRGYLSELEVATAARSRATAALTRDEFAAAVLAGKESLDILQEVSLRIRTAGSIAWFRSVQGDVRYARGETGEFLRAYPRVELNDGDYVRTGSQSSAEIHFRDEDTVFVLRPKSAMKLSRDLSGPEPSLGVMEYGWVRLDTAAAPSGIKTPFSELTVAENSKVSLEIGEGSTESEVKVAQGRARVRSLRNGITRDLGEREQVTQTAAVFGPTVVLPPPPVLLLPADAASVDIDVTDRLTLEWQPVAGASRYALQVSRSRQFGDNDIDASDRAGTRATLGLDRLGTYLWRVAAYGRGGALGVWSEPRTFRVSSYQRLALEDDTEPPTLEFEMVVNGNIAVLRGKTEPGARIEINSEPVPVAADGAFLATEVLTGSGRVPVVVVASDRAGNHTEQRRWVLLDEG